MMCDEMISYTGRMSSNSAGSLIVSTVAPIARSRAAVRLTALRLAASASSQAGGFSRPKRGLRDRLGGLAAAPAGTAWAAGMASGGPALTPSGSKPGGRGLVPPPDSKPSVGLEPHTPPHQGG